MSDPLLSGGAAPLKAAEELVATLPGVISARIIGTPAGGIQEIHVLTTPEFTPKQTVRNIESALIAQLGLRVDHRKISVAISTEQPKPREATPTSTPAVDAAAAADAGRRRIYFEDVEVRRSRLRGVTCRVTLRKGDEMFVGEAEGMETERGRMELAARAALAAIALAESAAATLALDGARLIDAFDRQFAFVGVSARVGRETSLLTGTCEVRDGVETAAVLAVLDATNRWVTLTK
jgi:hypothetical protein